MSGIGAIINYSACLYVVDGSAASRNAFFLGYAMACDTLQGHLQTPKVGVGVDIVSTEAPGTSKFTYGGGRITYEISAALT